MGELNLKTSNVDTKSKSKSKMSPVTEATLLGFACDCCNKEVIGRTPIRKGTDEENFFCSFYCAAKWFAENEPSFENQIRFEKFEKLSNSFKKEE